MGSAVLIAVQSLEKGGRTRRIADEARGLQALGYTVYVVVFSQPPQHVCQNYLQDLSVTVLLKSPGTDFTMCFKLIRFIKQNSVNLVHAHCEQSYLYGGLAALWRRIPAVGTYHRSRLAYFQPDLKLRFFAGLLTHKVAISRQRQRLMEEGLRIPAQSITLIHGGVDLSQFTSVSDEQRQSLRRELGITAPYVIVSLGHLGEIKGHDDSLLALSQLPEHLADFHLYIAGDGSEQEYQRLRDRIADCGLTGRVSLLGQVDQAPRWLEACDLFLQPSREEGFGLVFVEAGACARPVVATNVGGIPDIVVPEETGLLVPPGQPRLLAEALARLMSDPDFARSLGEQGRKRIEQHFTIQQMVTKYQQLFDALINRR